MQFRREGICRSESVHRSKGLCRGELEGGKCVHYIEQRELEVIKPMIQEN